MLAGAILLTGCGGSSPTTGEGAVSPGATAPEAQALAFAGCMRSHGEPDYPDPTVGGTVHLGAGVDPSSPTFQAARKACGKLVPYGAKGGAPSPAEQAKMQELALKFSRCMRAHGVLGYPDPSGAGGAKMEKGIGIDSGSPQFRTAERVCQADLSGARGGGGGGGSEAAGNAVRIP